MAYTIALIGNPNVGKSVIFNNLVPGARQHVGNWPGKTVEKKEGHCTHKGNELTIVDLPGVYSLTARAMDELIARNYIVEDKPDVVVDIVDASNIERNLYLTYLLFELEANVVIALNMLDVAETRGYEIDAKKLSDRLGVPVVPTIAIEKKGMEALKDAIIKAATKKGKRKSKIKYDKKVEIVIKSVEDLIKKDKNLASRYPTRWVAIQLLENDEEVLRLIAESKYRNQIMEVIS